MGKILIVGGAGFIGSNLCKLFLEKGKEVVCVDNFITGRLENLSHFLSNSNFCLKTHNIVEPFEFENIEAIYNLACPASPKKYQKDAILTIETCFLGTLHLLEIARKNRCPLIQASTSEVYGDPKIYPQNENYWGNVNPVGIRSCYDEGKRCAETLCADYRRQHNVNVKIVRIFNTYGPNMACDDGRVISNFITQALANRPLTIYGDGSQTRSFMYIDDLLSALTRVLHTPNSFMGPVNLGNPQEISIRSLADKIISITESDSNFIYLSLPSDDPHRRRPDISFAKKTLNNWNPIITLDDGLKKTIEYFKSNQPKE